MTMMGIMAKTLGWANMSEKLYPIFYDNIAQRAFIRIDDESREIEVPYICFVKALKKGATHWTKLPKDAYGK